MATIIKEKDYKIIKHRVLGNVYTAVTVGNETAYISSDKTDMLTERNDHGMITASTPFEGPYIIFDNSDYSKKLEELRERDILSFDEVVRFYKHGWGCLRG